MKLILLLFIAIGAFADVNYLKKPFDYKSDMKAMCLSRDTKSYIYAKGLWEDYLKFLEIAIDSYLNK